MKAMLVAAMVLGLSTGLAEAKPLQHHHRHFTKQYAHKKRHHIASGQSEYLSHPSGCPWHDFCGCGVSVKIFGHIVSDLNLAWNWAKKFPHTSPAPGMVAVWRHHVVVLERQDGAGWIVYDPNSGGHKTREHHRSLAGAVIVNPHRG